MTTSTATQSTSRSASVRFNQSLNVLREQCRSFASCVRREYESIERAIEDGVPLEAIVVVLSEGYGIKGSLSALKSALSRIRRSHEGWRCQQWLDYHAPLHPRGTQDSSGAATNSSVPLGAGEFIADEYFPTAPQHPRGPHSHPGMGNQTQMPIRMQSASSRHSPSPEVYVPRSSPQSGPLNDWSSPTGFDSRPFIPSI